MDGLSSVAVVTQLLGQAINIWQQIDIVRATVKAAPKLLQDLSRQSANLHNILRDIKTSTGLHTPAIYDQLEYINAISSELQRILKRLDALNRQPLLRQSLHVLGHKTRDEAKLNDVLSRLDKAKSDLSIRMQLVQLEKTRDISQNVHEIVSDVRKDYTATPLQTVTVDRNHTDGTARQISSVAGLEEHKISVSVSITDNIALGRSRQNNLILCGPGSIALLQSILAEA